MNSIKQLYLDNKDIFLENPPQITVEAICMEKSEGMYRVFIFKDLNDQEIIDATLYPNWATSLPEIGEEGYLTYSEVIAGKSKWFSGDNYIPYNYTHRHLVRWIKKSDEIIKKQHYEKTTIFKITD